VKFNDAAKEYKAMRQDSKTVINQESEIIESESALISTSEREQLENLKRYLSESGFTLAGRVIRFAKGSWPCGQENADTEVAYIADVLDLLHCWSLYKGGKVIDRRVALIAAGERPVSRESLGDNDPSEWQPDMTGKRSDPCRASLEKDNAQADPTAISGKDWYWLLPISR
jgi:hypothetical protein